MMNKYFSLSLLFFISYIYTAFLYRVPVDLVGLDTSSAYVMYRVVKSAGGYLLSELFFVLSMMFIILGYYSGEKK